MAKSYEEILSMINKPDVTNEDLIGALRPNPLQSFSTGLMNVGLAMKGQSPQPQEDSAKDLIKAMVLAKIKSTGDIERSKMLEDYKAGLKSKQQNELLASLGMGGEQVPKTMSQGGTTYRPESINVGGINLKRQPTEAEMLAEEEQKERVLRQKEQSKARIDLDKYTSDATQSLMALNKLEREARNLGDFGTGVIPQAISKVSIGMRKFGQEPRVSKYMGVLAQELIPAARKIMEEKGPITEFDVQRVEKGLGETTAPLSTKIELLNELKSKIQQAVQNKMDVAGMSPDEFSKKYKTLSTTLGNIQSPIRAIDLTDVPQGVDPKDWNMATPQQKQEYLMSIQGQ